MQASGFLDLIFQYFRLYGYYLLFFGLLLENTVILGLIVPGETLLLAASFLASQGHFKLVYIILVTGAGAFIGNNIGYFLGRKGGRPFIEKFGEKYLFISEEQIRASEEYFDVHGGKTIFIGRFAAGIRVFIAPIAGASHMDYRKFFIYTLVSVGVWTVLLSMVGFVFGQHWKLLLSVLKRVGWGALVLLLLLVFLGFFSKFRKKGEQRRPPL